MKILQINASYKPAAIYGGPTMSVGKLCEELVKTQDIIHKTQDIEIRELEVGSRRSEDGGQKTGIESEKSEVRSPESEVESLKTEDRRPKTEVRGPESKVEGEKIKVESEETVQERGDLSSRRDDGLGIAGVALRQDGNRDDGGFDSAQPDIQKREQTKRAQELDNAISSLSAFPASLPKGEKSVEVEVYTTLANGKEELLYRNGEVRMVDGVSVHYFKRWTKDHSHFSPALLVYLWKTVKSFDVVHVHAWWNLVSVLSCWIAVFRGVPVLLTPRGTLSPYSFSQNQSFIKQFFHFIFVKPILPRLHFHLTSTKELKDTQLLVKGKSFTVIPNFVQLSEAVSDHISFEEGPLRLLFLSRIEQKKGLELLFDSLSELAIPFHLSIAGGGEEAYVNSLKLKVESLKLEEKVVWFGPVYGDDKFKLMANEHLLVLPSYDENFANVVIESLSVGTPVLISEGVGLADYVKEKELGWVCKRAVRAFRDKIAELNNQRNLMSTISARSRLQILSDFEENQLRNQYLQLYHQLLHESV